MHTCTVSDLDIFTEYTFQVRACTNKGCGLSLAATATTNPDIPGGIKLPTAEIINTTSFAASWQPPTSPNGIIDGYELWVAATFMSIPGWYS